MLQENKIPTQELRRFEFGYGDQPGRLKFILWDHKRRFHYTLVFNDKRRVIDLHKTYDDGRRTGRQQPIVKIGYFSCLKVFVALSKVQESIVKKYLRPRRIELAELNSMDAVLMPSNSNHVEDRIIDRQRKKIRIKDNVSINDIHDMFILPEEIIDVQADFFYVYYNDNRHLRLKGLLIANSNGESLIISKRKLDQFNTEIQSAFIDAIKSSNIPSKETLLSFFA
jgi:hypothetical protein